jgi:putative ABC transport system permease protein
MIRNFLTIALRNFRRQKGFAFINMLGLACGLASVTLIYLFILDETGFDRFHPGADQMYVLGTHGTYNGEEYHEMGAPGAWVKGLKDRYPDVTAGAQTLWMGYPASFRDPQTDKILLTEQELWVTPEFSRFFYFPLKYGDPRTVFSAPDGLVLSQTTARKFFGDRNPVGKVLELKHLSATGDKYVPLTVTGVMEDYPSNSHIRPDYLISMGMLEPVMKSTGRDWFGNWGDGPGWFSSYIKVKEHADVGKIARSFNGVVQANLPKNPEGSLEPYLVPLADLHFHEKIRSIQLYSGDLKYLYIFATTAVLVIVIASINYMNLATARAMRRAKEIGLRKVLGSSRRQLVGQFLGESLLTTLAALLVALVLVAVLLPAFNGVAGKSFTLAHLLDARLIGALLGTTLLVALLSGSYPALYLSGLQPVKVLKSNRFTGRSSETLRKGLVVMQYAITLVLIVATGIITKQMDFIRNSTLSKQSDQTLSIRWFGNLPLDKYRLFRQRVQEDPELQVVTLANHLPKQDYYGRPQVETTFPNLSNEKRQWDILQGDFGFPATFGLETIAGRSFDPRVPTDSVAFLLNETAVKALGSSPEQVVGMPILTSGRGDSLPVTGKVIGVVRDFSYRTMHQAISPAVIQGKPHRYDQIVYVKLPAGKFQEKIAGLEQKWKDVLPGYGFDHWFVSQEFDRMYEGESRMNDLFRTFSLLAIVIACLGLFGLSSYLAQRRTREIGIRKVMGASVPQMIRLLFGTFVRLMAVACLFAIPLGWYAMHSWLQDFTYRVDIDAFIFVLGVGLVLVLTVLTVSYETVRAATANPVETLRAE